MHKKRDMGKNDCLRLNPETRLCPQFDSTGIAMFRRASLDEMGFSVDDDCAEEHIM